MRGLRLGIRAMAMSLVALSLLAGIAPPGSLVAAVLGAGLGIPLGQALSRSRLRLPLIVAALGLLVVGAFEGASLALRSTAIPAWLGTGVALRAGSVVRFGTASLGASAVLRAVAARRSSVASFELLVLAAAVPTVFASHRDGVIARPLWLTDITWQYGIDPTQMFLAIGALAVVMLAMLRLVETRSGRAFSSMLAALWVATLAFVLIPLVGLPAPQPPNDLGLRGMDDSDAGMPFELATGDGTHGGDARPDASSPQDGGLSGDAGLRAQSEHLDEEASAHGGEAPMAVVLLDDDYVPPSQDFYLRQAAWSQWNGARLVRATRADVDRDGAESFPAAHTEVLDPPPQDGRTRVHALVALLVEHAQPFALESPVRFEPVPNPNPARFWRAYRVESLAQTLPYAALFGRKAGSPAWSDAVRAVYTEAPRDPRYGALAAAIVARLPSSRSRDPFAMALAIKLWLDDQVTYSRRHRHAGVDDPTADFLFGDRTGYCVHFAHAAVLLARTLGIPARVGTGYHVSEEDRHGSSTLLVRSADAHAWPELYLEGAGWIVLDVMPTKSLDELPAPVDAEVQRLLGEMARQMPPDPEATGRPLLAAVSEAVLRALGIAGGLGLGLLYLVKLWRRLAPRWVRRSTLPIAGYRAALDLLAEVGMWRRSGETREAFAQRVATLTPSLGALTRLHLRAALGAPSDDPRREEVSRPRWRAGLREVQSELRRGVARWRRLAGLVNPVSFLRSR